MPALENHGGGVTVTAGQLLRLVRAIESTSFGVNLDTGNFHGDAPYAINVQVKTETRREGRSKEPADMARVVDILREARDSDYLVLEYDAAGDPLTAVPRYVRELQRLIR